MTSLEETEVRKVSKSEFQENLQKQEKILNVRKMWRIDPYNH